jgi:recombination protein RecT
MNDPKQAVATAARKDVRDMLQSPANLAEMLKVLPKHLTPERMVRVALTAFLKTPKLLECTRESLTQALMVCSQAGLEPDGRLAHLIPYGNVCQVIFDWKGLVALGLRNGFQSIYADVVFEGDEFEAGVENGVKMLRHRPNWRGDRGEPILFYCVAMKSGVLDYEIMSFAETEAIKQRSRAKGSGPWVTDDLEMGKKCPIRRMSKRWDLLPEIRDIIYAEDDAPKDIPKEIRMARPIFSPPSLPEPPPPVENGKAPEPAPEPPPTSASDPKPETPTASEKAGGFNPLKAVRNLAKMASVTESEVLEFCQSHGMTDGSQGELGEVPKNILQALADKWPDVAQEIKAARAGGESKGGLL